MWTVSLTQVAYFCCRLVLKAFNVEALYGLQPYGLTATDSCALGGFTQGSRELPNTGIPWP